MCGTALLSAGCFPSLGPDQQQCQCGAQTSPSISKGALEEVVPPLTENVTKKEHKKLAVGFGNGWWH